MAQKPVPNALIVELEPVVQRELRRHIDSEDLWYAHDYVPFEQGENFAFLGGRDWDPSQVTLPRNVTDALEILLIIKDNLAGYHREFVPNPARALLRPIHDAEGSFLMTPMEQGIRVTSGVELTARDAPSSFVQLDAVVEVARGVVEFGEAVGEPWRGARPTLPDSLPMIGLAPRHKGLWLAFGNQHIGFTTGPATGEAIAAMIAGAPPSFDTSAFAPARYI